MRKFLTKFLIIFSVFAVSHILNAQDICHTIVSNKQKIGEASIVVPSSYSEKVNKTFEITVWVRANDLSLQTQINNALVDCQKYFNPIGVKFSACNFRIIEDPNYKDILPESGLEKEMQTLYYNAGTINMYFVEYSGAQLNTWGYSYMPFDSIDMIVLNKNKFDSYVMAHQLGHFFGLYHTHETTFGGELVNGSNCSTAGDKICDTPAEPNLYYLVGADCKYVGTNKDANSQFYVPTVANIMNLTSAKCGCIFTEMQYKKMVYVIKEYKSYLR